MAGVPLAFRCTGATRASARHDLRAAEVEIQLSLASRDLPCGVAYHSAIEAEADAFDELRHVRLAEAGVGASRTDLLTFDAGLDTLDQRCLVAFVSLDSRMKVQHLANQALRALDGCHRVAPET
jgi:hypothetical protein